MLSYVEPSLFSATETVRDAWLSRIVQPSGSIASMRRCSSTKE